MASSAKMSPPRTPVSLASIRRSMESAVAASPEAPLLKAHPTPAARIPGAIRFPLLCAVSLGMSMLCNTLISEYSGMQLAAPSRDLEQPWQISTMLGWKVVQLFTAWIAGYDYQDLAALTFLTNYPFYYLLNAFWGVESAAMFVSVTIDVASVAIPFALLRPVSHIKVIRTSNQVIAYDRVVMALVSGLGVAIYATFFYLTYHASVTVFMVSHFNVLSLENAHGSTIPQLLQHFALNGIGAMLFLFKPAMAAPGRPSLTDPAASPSKAGGARSHRAFRPDSATLAETLAYNLGLYETGWSYRAEVLLKRTSVLAVCVFANTAIRAFGAIEGTDAVGALGWAGMWTLANALVGAAYALLENEY